MRFFPRSKEAHGIVDTETKAEHFTRLFVNKIGKLGTIFSQIQKLEKENSKTERDLSLLAAEYEMQDIGELAQLISDRPPLWNLGRHILSPQHLMWISLMRKMMAHYPLLLAPHIMRWNLQYLAFDTGNILTTKTPYATQPVKTAKRRPVTYKDLGKKYLKLRIT